MPPSNPPSDSATALFVGIDVGTSGCRAVAVDGEGHEVAGAHLPLPPPTRDGAAVEQDPEVWWQGLCRTLDELLARIPRERVRAIAVDGTSGTVLVTDRTGHVLAPALLYNDSRAQAEAERIRALAPRDSAAHGAASGLAKLLWLAARLPDIHRVHTPADWLASRLCGVTGVSDANNVVKLGWDPVAKQWPTWLDACIDRAVLPRVVEPGAALGALTGAMAQRFGLAPDARVVAGTTDSTAAVIATGAREVGDAVTSLGSTLVMKVIAPAPVFAPEYGVYSQPYGDRWLVGGGSNTGGAVLAHYFSAQALSALESELRPEQPTGLDYYPLLTPGERFPINDPRLLPRLTPRPPADAEFLQGMLEAMARIEAQSYGRLAELGAPSPRRVISAGGGGRNRAWSLIRARALSVPVERASHDEAAYGSALLARGHFT